MEWRDEGLIIGLRRHGESSVILEAMTRGRGRCLGLVRGGRSQRMRGMLQPGNSAALVWRARLDEHLGVFAVEPTQLRAARHMTNAQALHGFGLAGALLRLIAERDPHPALYDAASDLADHLGEARGPASLARFELQILRETGFGLDLTRCAATGTSENLIYVSPKSGRAVSRQAGEPYRDRLLPLPAFLVGDDEAAPGAQDLADAFALTGHFLERDLFAPRGLAVPDSRRAYLAALQQNAGLAEGGAGAREEKEAEPLT